MYSFASPSNLTHSSVVSFSDVKTSLLRGRVDFLEGSRGASLRNSEEAAAPSASGEFDSEAFARLLGAPSMESAVLFFCRLGEGPDSDGGTTEAVCPFVVVEFTTCRRLANWPCSENNWLLCR
jgi:hypothetical protein